MRQGFVIANEEGLNIQDPSQKAVLDKLLNQLKSDSDWDLQDPRQKAFADLKELRYFYAKENLAGWEAKFAKETKIQRSAESRSKNLALEGPEEAPQVEIKLEAGLAEFLEVLKELDNVKTKLQRCEAPGQDVLAQLKHKAQSDSSLDKFVKETEDFVQKVVAKVQAARDLFARAQEASRNSTFAAFKKQVQEAVETTGADAVVAAAQLRKLKQLCV